ncbi:PREDICTED: uncharacterized protein ENSP00000372125 [Nanorana parkeri]|uniref:uncharacterized protein ENSP00000372125 n=1 Tax=Nanorana parkeri TaxID=125878 RepID=UPI0008550504|nr:PREDICTED: uncharacterized protein ENSP00000372125 [Nanorana parkeri]
MTSSDVGFSRSTDMSMAVIPSPHPEPLLSEPPVHSPGFAPRGIHRLLFQSPPYSDAKLELLRKLRSPLRVEQPPSHTLGYVTWLEVSRLPPLLPLLPDRPYDSAVWRQVTVAPASARPREPIPAPSRMEENTWSKFTRCSGVQRDTREARALNIRSQGRAPAMDSHGNILPPPGHKRYPSLGGGGAISDLEPAVLGPKESGFFSTPQHQNKPLKLTLQSNSPNYSQILQRYQELQRGARTVVPHNSRMNTPRITPRVT